jgi:hypothetical protein
LLGWAVWKLAKRRLRKKLHTDDEGVPRRRTALRTVGAVAALAALGAVWSKRSRGAGDASE